MSILPPAATEAQQTPAKVFAQRMARVDGCPRCIENYETPRAVIAQESGFTASYHCAPCDRYWLTNWRG